MLVFLILDRCGKDTLYRPIFTYDQKTGDGLHGCNGCDVSGTSVILRPSPRPERVELRSPELRRSGFRASDC